MMQRKIKVRLGDLKQILREEILHEADPKKKTTKEDGEASIDSQIDRYLTEYESEAKSSKTEGKDWRRTVRRLVEESDDDELDLNSDDNKKSDIKTLTSDDIDVESFTNSVMRLVQNYDSLLEIRNTLLRRAANFLGKNYESEVVDSFKENLRSEHGIEIGKSPEDVIDKEFPAPAAARAGSGGSGGA